MHIIDDSEADQFLSKHAIESYDQNIAVHQAYDGSEAMDLIDKALKKPDIIFLDINMPGMTGFEFLDAFKEKTIKHFQIL